jgi:hypothetical protein
MRSLRVVATAAVVMLAAATSAVAVTRTQAAGPFFSDIGAGMTGVTGDGAAWGDYDGDGRLDVLYAAYTANASHVSRVYRNPGSAPFVQAAALAEVADGTVAWTDYDADGKLDPMVSGNSSSYHLISVLYHGAGNGSFVENTKASLAGFQEGTIAWGDYNGDGRLDVIVTGDGGPSWSSHIPTTRLYRNNGDGSFALVTSTGLPELSYGAAAWSDYDVDGDLDLLLSGADAAQHRISKLYRNNGSGGFSEATNVSLPGLYVSAAAWGDYNSDGFPDLLLAGMNSSGQRVTKLYRNNKQGGLVEVAAALPGILAGSVAWGDYDANGSLDILLSGNASSNSGLTRLYRNAGNAGFQEVAAAGLPTSLTGVGAWGDYDSDGKLDILLTGSLDEHTKIARVYRNNTLGTNAPPSAPGHLSSVASSKLGGKQVTLKWWASSDDHTPSVALSYNVRVGTKRGACDVVTPLSLFSGKRLVPQTGNAGERTSYTLRNLRPGTYYWAVQAIDGSFAGSGFGRGGVFRVAQLRG